MIIFSYFNLSHGVIILIVPCVCSVWSDATSNLVGGGGGLGAESWNKFLCFQVEDKLE